MTPICGTLVLKRSLLELYDGSRACRSDILVHFHQVTDQYLVTAASHFETQHDMET